MKKQFLYATVAAFALAGAPTAAQSTQSPTSSSPSSPTSQSSQSSESKTTITGCVTAGADGHTFTLKPDTSSSSGYGGSTSGTPSSGTPSTPSTSQPGSSTSGGAQSSTGMSSATQQYVLTPASSSVDLSQYAGKKVQVTGTVDRSSAPSTSSPSSSSSSSAAGPKFQVQSVRVISDTCS